MDDLRTVLALISALAGASLLMAGVMVSLRCADHPTARRRGHLALWTYGVLFVAASLTLWQRQRSPAEDQALADVSPQPPTSAPREEATPKTQPSGPRESAADTASAREGRTSLEAARAPSGRVSPVPAAWDRHDVVPRGGTGSDVRSSPSLERGEEREARLTDTLYAVVGHVFDMIERWFFTYGWLADTHQRVQVDTVGTALPGSARGVLPQGSPPVIGTFDLSKKAQQRLKTLQTQRKELPSLQRVEKRDRAATSAGR